MPSRLQVDKCASAPTLAVFTIFVILCSSVAIVTFQSMEEREVPSIVLESAADVTRATASQVESELNTALESSITAAMYDVGLMGGTRKEVENYIRDYMNVHIVEVNASSPPNLKKNVSTCDENSLILEWLPDGSIRARGFLDASFKHVMGPKAFGVRLHVVTCPRFERIKHIAELASRVPDPMKLNDNYACEGIRIELENDTLVVKDIFGAREVIVP